MLGTPTQESWPVRFPHLSSDPCNNDCHLSNWSIVPLQEIAELPDYNKITFKENPAIPLDDIVPDASPQAVDLLHRFLVYPSKQRCSASQVAAKSGYVYSTVLSLSLLSIPFMNDTKKTEFSIPVMTELVAVSSPGSPPSLFLLGSPPSAPLRAAHRSQGGAPLQATPARPAC